MDPPGSVSLLVRTTQKAISASGRLSPDAQNCGGVEAQMWKKHEKANLRETDGTPTPSSKRSYNL